MGAVWMTLTVAVVYLAITGNLALNNVLAGLLIGAAVAALLRPASSLVPLRAAPIALWALFRYAVVLAVDIVRSGLDVARLVLNPRLPIRPAILAVKSERKTELSLALSSHAISVTPGSSVLAVDDDGTLYVHVLDATEAEETLAHAQSVRRSILSRIAE